VSSISLIRKREEGDSGTLQVNAGGRKTRRHAKSKGERRKRREEGKSVTFMSRCHTISDMQYTQF
jgi:hypothetical protein